MALIKSAQYLVNHSRSCLAMERSSKLDTYMCCFCEYHTYKKNDMLKHIRRHLGEKPFQCEFCDYKSSAPSDLQTHKRIRHSCSTVIENVPEEVGQMSKYYTKGRKKMFSAFIVRTILKVIPCVYCCKYLTKNAEILLHHCKSCFAMERLGVSYNYMCFTCEYHTNNNHNMLRHIRRHLGEKPFQCEFCDYKSSAPSDLQTHKRIRHSSSTVVYIVSFRWISEVILCVYCCKLLTKNAEILLHHCKTCFAMERLGVSYNYMCFTCEYHTNNNHNMLRHIRRHLGEKPFQCEFCDYKSSAPSDLQTHKRIRHSSSTVV
ncbi:zinc finger protein 271-like [Diaphorina citri]|uniref:Zinc finger protein 271-like n=1 Tax=Diaphorina citri TaxID=121845 RepID=A0A3Q0JJU6_DIACI|nr:zinc finger protein 271-like [Diaphorina citri]